MHLPSTRRSVTLHWWLKIGHGESSYIMEIGNAMKQDFFFLPRELFSIHPLITGYSSF